jgi:hypothetical protein
MPIIETLSQSELGSVPDDFYQELYFPVAQAEKYIIQKHPSLESVLNALRIEGFTAERQAELEDWYQFEDYLREIVKKDIHAHLAANPNQKAQILINIQKNSEKLIPQRFWQHILLKEILQEECTALLQGREKHKKIRHLYFQKLIDEAMYRDLHDFFSNTYYKSHRMRHYEVMDALEQRQRAMADFSNYFFQLLLLRETDFWLTFFRSYPFNLQFDSDKMILQSLKKIKLQRNCEALLKVLVDLNREHLTDKKILEKIKIVTHLFDILLSEGMAIADQLEQFSFEFNAKLSKLRGDAEKPYLNKMICLLMQGQNLEWAKLNQEEFKLLLNDDDFIAVIDIHDFLKFVGSSAKATAWILQDNNLKKKIDQLKVQPNHQHFKNSCAAYSILMALIESKLLPENKATLSKELEIYSAIWRKPGEIADSQKIIDFFAREYPSLKITRLMMEPFISKKLTDTHFLLKQKNLTQDKKKKLNLTQESFQRFIKHADSELKIAKAVSFFGQGQLPAEDRLVLLVLTSDDMPHVILGLNNVNCFETIDPANGKRIRYDNFSEFLQKEESFSGISFTLSSR